MANDASVHITGNLIKEPVHNVTNGQTVVSFTVAVNTTLKKQSGDGYESNFYNVSVWGKPAEWALEKIQKGTQVEVVGDLIAQPYESKNGVKGQSLNIRAFKVTPRARMKGAPVRENAGMDPTPSTDTIPF